ncbi:MAG: hypothetical protein ACR2OJ_10930 [Hyphomicrobiales bacterium]
MTQQDLKQQLIDTYNQFYVEGFKNNDIALIDRIVDYPLTYIKNGTVSSVERYPVNPAELKAQTGWDHSKDWHFDVPAITETSAHVVASATRCRKDGSVIERVHGFYAFRKVDGVWKMYALADQVF